jgi:hypothetical protein
MFGETTGASSRLVLLIIAGDTFNLFLMSTVDKHDKDQFTQPSTNLPSRIDSI